MAPSAVAPDGDATGPESALIRPVLRAVAGIDAGGVVLIDGPSGAGKSSLADALLHRWPGSVPPTLVRLDDIYPGWGGLEAAVEQVRTQVLQPRREGRPAAWQRYDWARQQPAEWIGIDPAHPLIIEGCGALAAEHAALSDVRVWIGADDALRKKRALDRDGALFSPHWDQWQQDWAAYLLRHAPEQTATVRLRAGD
ncbi:MAG: ATP-binding protein [Cryobacterium sp.]